MSIKPRIVCPPNYSILSLRFTECKKLGIVKGKDTLLSVDLQPFYIPVTFYSLRKFTVKAGKDMKLEIGDIASYYPLQEKYRFQTINAQVDNGVGGATTSHRFEVFDDYGVSKGAVTFTCDINDLNPELHTFKKAIAYTVGLHPVLSGLVSVAPQTTPQPPVGYGDSAVTVTATAAGEKYRYLLTYDTGSWSGGPYDHPGTLLQKDFKYPNGAVRGIYLYAEFQRADASTCTCGCLDASGELLSNVKNYQWAWDSEYTRKQYKADESGVIVNADAGDPSQVFGTGQEFQWLTTGNPFAYNLLVGELITLDSTAFNPYGYITDVDGYNIYVDRPGFGAGIGDEEILKRYAPAPLDWRTGGELLFLTAGQDVYEVDRLYTETIWINNIQNYDIPFTAIIVS